MLNLGSFQKDEKSGKISGVMYGVNMHPTNLIFEPTASDKGSPYYRVYAECEQAVVEAGAAWPKIAKNENARSYLDVKLNSPALGRPFYGKLFESDVIPNQHHLLWTEPDAAAPKPEITTNVGQTPRRYPSASVTP
jgi:uncharacterized protein (DUF736 family)